MSADKKSKLFVECSTVDKSAWVRAARESNRNLETWVNDVLNQASGSIVSSNPGDGWQSRFGSKTKRVLEAAGIVSEKDLIERIQEDSLFNIVGMTAAIDKELQDWHYGKGSQWRVRSA